MAKRDVLMPWVLEAVERLGGEAEVIDVAKEIWRNHRDDLEASGDLFFSWQYDMRWAAQKLRSLGKLELRGRKWAAPDKTVV